MSSHATNLVSMRNLLLHFRVASLGSAIDGGSCDVSALQYRLGPTTADDDGGISEGRLEVYYKSRWQTVCDQTFGTPEARVVCVSIGFTG